MGAAAAVSPFVGRAEEQQTLFDLLGRVASRKSDVVVIEGEAGIGKTRLLEKALVPAPTLGIRVFRSVAQELERTRPFGAIADALDLELSSADPDRARIAHLVCGRLDEPADTLPAVAAGPGLHYRVLEAIVELVERTASAGPMVVAMEDLHWSDPSSLLTLHALRRRLAHLPIGLVLTCRPLPQGPELERLLEGIIADGGTHVVVGPLHNDEVETLATSVAGSPPGETLRRQLRRARGNPLFVTELMRALADEGAFVSSDGRIELASPGLPLSLRIMLLRRLSYLSRDTLEVLRLASVLGSTFEVSHLALATRRSAVALMPVIDEARRAGVLGEAGARFTFRHDLIREAIYTDLAPALRAGLHLEVGRALAGAGAPAIQVAEHFSLGASPGDRQAVGWLHDAARETLSRAPGEAVHLFERAVDLAGPRFPDRDVLLADLVVAKLWAGRVPDADAAAREILSRDHDRSVDGLVRLALIEALIAQGRTVEAVAESAIALDQAGLPGGVRAQLSGFASLGLLFTGDGDAATVAAEAACTDGERLGDVVAVCLGLNSLSMIATVQGHAARAVELARQASEYAEKGESSGAIPYRWQTNITLAVTSMDADQLTEAEAVLFDGRRRCEDLAVMWPLPLYQWALVWLYFRRGAWDYALAQARAGFAMVDKGQMRFGAVSVHGASAMIAIHRNDLRAARAALAAGHAELEATGPQYLAEWLLWARAMLEEAAGRHAAATEALEQAWLLCGRAGALVAYPELGPDLVRLLVRGGGVDRARVVADQVEEVAARMRTPSAQGAALRCRGLVEGDSEALLEAVAVLREGPRPLVRAAACEDAGNRLSLGDRRAEALELLQEALDAVEDIGAVRDVARIEARLRAMGMSRGRRGARARRPEAGWESLTGTEHQVVRLAVEGLTNREIAQRLYISPRTAETHLRHVFTKLGLSSRADLRASAMARAMAPAEAPGSPSGA